MTKAKRILIFLFSIAILLSAVLPISASIKPNYAAYEYSEAYKSSNYYAQLLDAKEKLTGDQRYDVILIALSQLGYHEGDSDDDMDGWNLDGDGNYVEYNRLFCKLDGIWGYAWCAAFVSWCQFQAGVPSEIDCSEVSCPRMINEVLKPQQLYKTRESGYTPLIGDLIFFKSASSNAVSSHVGLVIGIKDGYVYTIEGNAGQCVGRHKYSLNDSYIVGYGALKYETKEGTDYSVFELTNSDMTTGRYTVTASTLNVRSGIGTSFPVIGELKKGDEVNIIECTDGWAKLVINGQEGWVSEAYLKRTNYTAVTLSYKLGGGKFSVSQKRMLPGTEYTLPTDIPTLYMHTFKGWATEKDGEAIYKPGDKLTVNENISLFAVWTPEMFTVTFLDHDGTLLATAECAYNTKVTPPEGLNPTRENDGEYAYEFAGWSPQLSSFLKSDATYTATYTSRPLTDEEKAPPTEAPTEAPSETEPVKNGGCASSAAAAFILPLFLLVFKKRK